jgi:hypothetical protein
MSNNQHFEQKAAELQNDLRTGHSKQASALLQFAYFENPAEALALVRQSTRQQDGNNLYVLVEPNGGVSVRDRSRSEADPDSSIYAVKMPELLQQHAPSPPPPRELAPPPMPVRQPEAVYQPPAAVYQRPPEQVYPPVPPPQAMYAPQPQPYYSGPSVGEQIGSALAGLGQGIGAVALGVLGAGLTVGAGRRGTFVQLGGGGGYGGEGYYSGYHHHPYYRPVMVPPPVYYGMQGQVPPPYFGPQQQFSGPPPQYAFAQPVPPPYQFGPQVQTPSDIPQDGQPLDDQDNG